LLKRRFEYSLDDQPPTHRATSTIPSVDIRRTYFYLVCLVTLIILIIGGAQIVNRGLDLLLPPEPYRPLAHELAGPRGEAMDSLALIEAERRSELEVERQRRDQRRNAIRGLIGSIALVLIAAPIYWYHWRSIRREEPAARVKPSSSESDA
jgi:hypothetical protein